MIQARSESAPVSGTLTLAATSAGLPADVLTRFKGALAETGLIAAPDASRLRSLAAALGVALAGRVVSWTGSPPGLVTELLAELRSGQDVLVVTDAGPAGTDEAVRRLITAAAAADIRVTALPGPSAVIAALAVSGLPADRFTFEGAPPRAAERERRFAELATERRTLIFSESPGRLAQTLAELAVALGASRPAVVCQLLATADQDVRRGALGELAGSTSTGLHGYAAGDDVTVVVAGAPVPAAGAMAPTEPEALEDAVGQVRALVRNGATTRDAVTAVATQAGLRKRDLYNAASRGNPAPPSDGPSDRAFR